MSTVVATVYSCVLHWWLKLYGHYFFNLTDLLTICVDPKESGPVNIAFTYLEAINLTFLDM